MELTTKIVNKYNTKSALKLDSELWRLVSLWIRQKDADENGMVKCVTCGDSYHWRDVDAGHFISRRNKITKFLEINLGPQCSGCNRFEDGRPAVFARYIDQKHGSGTAQYLESLSKQSIHISRIDYIQQIENYKEKLKANKMQLK